MASAFSAANGHTAGAFSAQGRGQLPALGVAPLIEECAVLLEEHGEGGPAEDDAAEEERLHQRHENDGFPSAHRHGSERLGFPGYG